MRNGLLLLLLIVVLLANRREQQVERDSDTAPDSSEIDESQVKRDSYTEPDIPEIDPSQIAPLVVEYRPFEDESFAGDGRVVIDLAHANNLQVNDLSPLRGRLEAREASIEIFDGNGDLLPDMLHNATALLVIAPTVEFTAEEREAIVDFVADGGKLLLAADPTRPVPEEESEFVDLYSAFFPTSAVPAINSLASGFGVAYVDDYVYNLDDNAGNYRNVKFTTFDAEHPLTQDIELVVFFAAHSLRSNGLALVVGDEQTRSPVRSGESGLTTVALVSDERVLALGDVTFLTAPYHTIGDNDHFLSHIADWLAVDTRARDGLDDFPYLFAGPVDLVQASGDFIDPQLIARGGELVEFFDRAGLVLSLRGDVQPGHDALLVGVFDDVESVREYLVTAGISITVSTDVQAGEDEQTEEIIEVDVDIDVDVEETMPEETPIGETLVEATPAAQAPVEELEIEAEEDVVEEAEEEEPPSNNLPGTITIETLGSIGIQGTTLFVIDRSSNGVAIVVLAQDGAAAIAAIDRLQTNDLSNCIQVEMVTICSTGESQDRLEAEIDDESPPDDEEEPSNGSSGGRVFILSDDGKAEGTRTSAAEFQAILSESYDVVVWSMAQDGAPTEDDLAGYDVYIIDSGDYAFDIDNADALSTLDYIESGGVMFAGAQSVPFLGTEQEPINDLQVADASHPLADGFTQDEVLALFESESDVLSVVVGDDLGDEAQAVFARGPDSPESGTAALVAVIDEGEAVSRIIITTFAFHRLPEDVQRTLALNAVEWLMIAGD